MAVPLTDIKAIELNVKREVYVGRDAKLLFLKPDGGAQPYSLVVALLDKWGPDDADQFGSSTFAVARIDREFSTIVEDSAYVLVIDSVNEALNNQLQAINRDTTRPPAGEKMYWRIRADLRGKRYTPA